MAKLYNALSRDVVDAKLTHTQMMIKQIQGGMLHVELWKHRDAALGSGNQ